MFPSKRRWSCLAASLFLVVFALPAFAELPFQDGDRIVFLGDSITQAGQYAAFTEAYLWAKYPDKNFEVINLGLSSETANNASEADHPGHRPCIHDRLGPALSMSKPDWVLVCYGMNDGIYHPANEQRFADYRDGILKLVRRAKAAGAKVILLTPPPFDAATRVMKGAKVKPLDAEVFGYKTPYEGYDTVLEGYAEWILSQTGEADYVVDLHTPMRAYIETCREANPEYAYGDGVHPPIEGHLRMCLALLGALGEDEAGARTLLTRLTGQGLYPGETGIDVGASPRFLKALIDRNNMLSLSWRAAVAPPDKKYAGALPLDEAQAKADEEKSELRHEAAGKAH